MPPKLARNKSSKEPQMEYSPQILALQQQIDSIYRLSELMVETPVDLKQKLNKFRSETQANKEVIRLSSEDILELFKNSVKEKRVEP